MGLSSDDYCKSTDEVYIQKVWIALKTTVINSTQANQIKKKKKHSSHRKDRNAQT